MKKRAQDQAQELLNRIASFYAGKQTRVLLDAPKPGTPTGQWGSGGWGGTFFDGNVYLGPYQAAMLRQLLVNPRAKSAPGTVAGLATLIHEAVHGRDPQPGTGFKDWSDERQANALGSELVADALQRFLGVKMGSKQSDAFMKAAKNLSGYRWAYDQQ